MSVMSNGLSVQVTSWLPQRQNTRIGFRDVVIPELTLKIHEVPVFMQNDKRWVLFPAKPLISVNGQVAHDISGRTQYAPVLQILDAGIRRKFSAAVVAALLEFAPHAFDTEY
jgi:hypothetical protein